MAIAQSELRRIQIIRWIIYGLVASAVITPFLLKFALPFQPSPKAVMFYDEIQKLDEGTRVLIALDFDPAAEAELRPMSMAVLRHCYERKLVPVIMTHWPRGIGLTRNVCQQVAKEYNKESGKDYVFLGYKPGLFNLVLNIGEDLKGAFDKDFFGQPTEGMAALEGIDKLADFELVVGIEAGITYEYWIAYGTDRHDIPFIAGTTAVMTPDLYPFIDSGQMKGFLGGLRGAADYEQLIDKSDDATQGMAAQSMAHLLIIALIIFANVRFVLIPLYMKKRTSHGRA
jgi:hypothetical protein